MVSTEALDPIGARLRIGSWRGVCVAFMDRGRNEASSQKVEQKHEHEAADKFEHKPSHICLRIKQGVEHEHPKTSGENRDAHGDEHGSRETREIPGKLVVHRPPSPPRGVDFYGQALGQGQFAFLRAAPVAKPVELKQV